MKLIALTGGIASGKSTVLAMLKKKQLTCFNTDTFAQELIASDEGVFNAMNKRYGSRLIEHGEINRDKLRAMICEHDKEKQWLESLLHPLIIQRVHQALKPLLASDSVVILEVQLIEVAMDYINFDKICVVECTKHQQISRIRDRSQWSKHQIDVMINQQLRVEQYRDYADIWIHNKFDINALESSVAWLYKTVASIDHG